MNDAQIEELKLRARKFFKRTYPDATEAQMLFAEALALLGASVAILNEAENKREWEKRT